MHWLTEQIACRAFRDAIDEDDEQSLLKAATTLLLLALPDNAAVCANLLSVSLALR